MKTAASMPRILIARLFLPVVRACAIAAGIALCGCSTSHIYPALRDLPQPPADTTSQAERQRIINELEKERENPTSPSAPGHEPAVPPLPAKPAQQSSELEAASVVCESSAAVPALRGTLHGDWHPPAGMSQTDRPASPKSPPERTPPSADTSGGSGITGSITAQPTDPRGALVLGFAAGAAALADEDVKRLRSAVIDFTLQGGTSVQVKARGGARTGMVVAHRPLASLSLGLSRATAIVNALIAAGIRPDRIKIAAQGDEEVPAVAAEDWSKAGPDGAIVIFEPVKP